MFSAGVVLGDDSLNFGLTFDKSRNLWDLMGGGGETKLALEFEQISEQYAWLCSCQNCFVK